MSNTADATTVGLRPGRDTSCRALSALRVGANDLHGSCQAAAGPSQRLRVSIRRSRSESLSRFIANERKCCPFMTFELEIAAASGPIWLRMTGPEGTRDVLEAELRLASGAPASSCGCGPSDVMNSQPPSTARTNRLLRWTTAGGMFAALGIFAACCLLPSVLLSLGIAGAWVSTLDSLARYEWIFIAAAALLGYGFYLVGQASKKGGGSRGE